MTGLAGPRWSRGRHLLSGLRELPLRRGRQDGHRRARLPEGPRPTRPGTSALAPANDPEIVVAVTVERGGFGVDSAAPVAARILEKYFNAGSGRVTAGGAAANVPGRTLTE